MAQPILAVIGMRETWQRHYFQKQFDDNIQLQFIDQPIHQSIDALRDATILCVFVHDRVSKEIIEQLPQLQMIATRSTGFDHIDVDACKKAGITVCNVPTYGSRTVAEYSFMLMLALAKQFKQTLQFTKERRFDFDDLLGCDLYGKTLGVIGTGHIGQCVLKIAHGFGMQCLAYDINPRTDCDMPVTYTSLENLLHASDIVSLHAPYSPMTHHMINSENLAFMKKDALLINTARGCLIETEALLKHLNDGKLGGVGLDVIEDETIYLKHLVYPIDHLTTEQKRILHLNEQLVHHPNVIYTPHIAYFTEEAIDRILDTTANTIQQFVAGHKSNAVR